MSPIDRLIAAFERFPGIGPRQARRFVSFLLSQNNATRGDIADSIRALGAAAATCSCCYRWFLKDQGRGGVCAVCGDPKRDAGLLMVVEKEADIDNVERGGYRGLYFVLGGTAPLAEERPEKYIRMRELFLRVESDIAAGTLKEIILGLSATTEGDHTRLLLHEELRPRIEAYSVVVSTLGRGLSTGSELEYADPETIAQALKGRK